MGMATVIGLIVLGVVVIVAFLVVAPKLVLHFIKGPLEARIAAHYGPDEILMKDLKANSFGLESKGAWQLRGNGGLVLTGNNLHFFMFLPNSDLRIPLDAITELTLTKGHAGKATVYDLLKVRFSLEDKSDAIAWYLTDPKTWKTSIEELMAGRPRN
jgi:hypothetical protein